jgi:hypothetical protein
MSKKSKIYFVVDLIIAAAFILSALSGVILYLVPGGYQGGRNPYYGTEILSLDHHGWSDLHTWTSFVMMAGIAVHLALHWRWIVAMAKNTLRLGQKRPAQQPCPVPIEVE